MYRKIIDQDSRIRSNKLHIIFIYIALTLGLIAAQSTLAAVITGGGRVLETNVVPPTSNDVMDKNSETPEIKNELGFDQNEAYVSDLKSWWTYSNVHYTRNTKYGNFGGRINFAKRYGTTGEQYQLEAYPKLSKSIYLSLIYAYANSTQIVFPTNYYLIEPYFALPKSFEVSIGQRYLKSQSQRIYTYTGTLGKYFGNYFTWFRPYHFTPKSAQLYELALRRYFADKYTYATIRVAAGRAPDIADLAPLNQIIILKTKGFNLDGQFHLTKSVYMRLGVGYARQVFPSGLVRRISDGSIGLLWCF